MISLLLATVLLGPVESVWTEKQPLVCFLNELKDHADKTEFQVPGNLAEIVELADTTVRVYGKPAQHYYKFEFEFRGRKLTGIKTLEVWGLGNETRFRSKVETSWGRNGSIIRWLLRRVELAVMGFERERIRTLVIGQ